MLDEVESAVVALLQPELPDGVVIRSGPPNGSWQVEPPASPVLGLFLHLVRASDSAVQGWSEERDSVGRVVRRTAAERRYDLCFLVTAWAADHSSELGLLGCLLRTAAQRSTVPRELLTGSLAQARGQLDLAVTPSAGPGIWSALGLPARTCLELVVTAPVAPVAVTVLAGPPDTIDLSIEHTGAPADPAVRRMPRPAARITEGPRDAAPRGQAG